MRLRDTLMLVVAILALALSPFPALAAPDVPGAWLPVANGIDYMEYHLSSPVPNNVFVARMARNNPNVTIESTIGQGKIVSGMETVRGQYNRYNQTLSYWGGEWGARSRAVIAINGYYNEPNGAPQRGQVISSWYAKYFSDNQSGSGFAWKMDRSAFIGECVFHPDGKQFVVNDANSRPYTFTLDGLNVARGSDDYVLYTPQYDWNTRTADGGTEVVIEMDEPATISDTGMDITGVVTQIRKGKGSTPIPYNAVVLSAGSGVRSVLENHLLVGDPVIIVLLMRNCDRTSTINWFGTYSSIGGDYYFIKNGALQNTTINQGATLRNPRTAIAFNDQYVYFIVVDGRNPGVSEGMTIKELGNLLRSDPFNATYAIAQDGGGSSTMMVDGFVRNYPSDNYDGCYRRPPPPPVNVVWKYHHYLPLAPSSASGSQSAAHSQAEIEETPDPTASPAPTQPADDSEQQAAGGCERAVPNGMMMVVVEPKQQSTQFSTGAALQVVTSTELRLGPGTNYAAAGTLSAGAAVQVVADRNGLGGVLAKGSFWWKVKASSGVIGWVKEEALRAAGQ